MFAALPLLLFPLLAQSEPLVVEIDGQPFAQVVTEGAQFPYVYPVLGPGGVPMTRGFPMDPKEGESEDHPHHRSFWFTHGDVNGFDFWHEGEKSGRIETVGRKMRIEGGCAVVDLDLVWIADGEILLSEKRTLRFGAEETRRCIDVEIELTARKHVVFGDTKEGSMALRVHPSLRLEGPVASGAIRNSEGHEGKGAWGKRARWVHYAGSIDGKPMGIAVFDHPQNLRHPTWWHARSYGLFAANPFGVHDFEGASKGAGNLALQNRQKLNLRYRTLFHSGRRTVTELEAEFDAFAEEDPIAYHNQPVPKEPAFEGAVGFGSKAQGGRGGDEFHVTTLDDYVENGKPLVGSLRFGLESARGPRTILFDVAGTLRLARELVIDGSRLTLDGSSAPGGGVEIDRRPVRIVNARDIVIRELRSRAPLSIRWSSRIILDHCSMDALIVDATRDLTVQESRVGGAILLGDVSNRDRAVGVGGFTLYGNLLLDGLTLGGQRDLDYGETELERHGLDIEIVNNVVYTLREYPGRTVLGSKIRANYLGNTIVTGPDRTTTGVFALHEQGNFALFHGNSNFADLDQDAEHDPAGIGDSAFKGISEPKSVPFGFPVKGEQVLSATDAYERVLQGAGASRFRDASDEAVIRRVRARR